LAFKMLSVVIPSYRDPLLNKTITGILESAEGDIEIIPVYDGYVPDELVQDPRVWPVFLKENVGMREAINAGVRASKGEYLMRTDEHCMFAPGFDTEILSEIEDNWIVTAKRYFLDVEKWEVMDIEPVIYEKLDILDNERWTKFHGQRWKSRDKERKDFMVDKTMAMQGSFWIMSRKHWDTVIKNLQPEYGTLYQDSTEMIMKTWQAGGELMINKNTWYAHKHVSFNRTHSYPKEEARKSFKYALDKWGQYYSEVVKPKWGI